LFLNGSGGMYTPNRWGCVHLICVVCTHPHMSVVHIPKRLEHKTGGDVYTRQVGMCTHQDRWGCVHQTGGAVYTSLVAIGI
jgi:hypothetical protein